MYDKISHVVLAETVCPLPYRPSSGVFTTSLFIDSTDISWLCAVRVVDVRCEGIVRNHVSACLYYPYLIWFFWFLALELNLFM